MASYADGVRAGAKLGASGLYPARRVGRAAGAARVGARRQASTAALSDAAALRALMEFPPGRASDRTAGGKTLAELLRPRRKRRKKATTRRKAKRKTTTRRRRKKVTTRRRPVGRRRKKCPTKRKLTCKKVRSAARRMSKGRTKKTRSRAAFLLGCTKTRKKRCKKRRK